jgi:hypothetical protein
LPGNLIMSTMMVSPAPHRQTLGRIGNDRVALVFDDLIPLDPFAARCLRVTNAPASPSSACPSW